MSSAIFLECRGVITPRRNELFEELESESSNVWQRIRIDDLVRCVSRPAIDAINALVESEATRRVSVIGVGPWTRRCRWKAVLREAGLRTYWFGDAAGHFDLPTLISMHLMVNRQIDRFVILAGDAQEWSPLDANYQHVIIGSHAEIGFHGAQLAAAKKILAGQFAAVNAEEE